MMAEGELDIGTHIDRTLTRLKQDLAEGHFTSLLGFLSSLQDVSGLTALREQRVLLKITDESHRVAAGEWYKDTARRLVMNPCECAFEFAYADFALLEADVRSQMVQTTNDLLRTLPVLSYEELISCFDTILDREIDRLTSEGWNDAVPELRARQARAPEVSAISERTAQAINGRLNDLAFAVARAFNAASAKTDPKKRFTSGANIRNTAEATALQLIHVASKLNGLDYVCDKVSYGEWVVSSVTPGNPPAVQFDCSDVLLTYARILGNRRELARRNLKGSRTGSRVRSLLEGLMQRFAQNCWEWLSASGHLVPRGGDMSSLLQRMQRRLDDLGPEDDLVIDAGAPDHVLSDYIGAIAIRWFCDVTGFLARTAPKRYASKLRIPSVHPRDIAIVLGLQDTSKTVQIEEAIARLLVQPPTRKYLDLINSPFLRTSSGHALCFKSLEGGHWTTTIRGRWLKQGDIGHKYGKAWEVTVENILCDFGWTVCGRGVKIRGSDGNMLCDVDLIALRKELLLVLQIKALAGEGMDPYDHWRSRQAIIKGASQAGLAVEYLRGHPSLTSDICKHAARDCRLIQPAVITNLHWYNGWRVGDIPVVSTSGLVSILRGAVVVYKRPDGTPVMEQQLANSPDLTSEEFVQFLHKPIDWQIAGEDLKAEHVTVTTPEMSLRIPSAVGGWDIDGTRDVNSE